MSETHKIVSIEDLFQAKEVRRRDAASRPVEEKIQTLIKLQHLTSEAARRAGREYKKPWDIELPERS